MRSIIKSDDEKDDKELNLGKQPEGTIHKLSNNKLREVQIRNNNNKIKRIDPEEEKRY